MAVRKSIAVLILILLLQVAALAQLTRESVIWGRVVMPDRSRVGGIEVRLELAGNIFVNSTTTDSDGRFQFRNLNEGTFYLHINMDGYAPVREEVRLRIPPPAPPGSAAVGGGTNEPTVTLYLRPGASDFGVPKTSRNADAPKDEPVSTTVVDADLIKKYGDKAVREYIDGVTDRDKGNLTRATSHFKKAIEINPKFYEAHLEAGKISQLDGRLSEAEATLQRARDLAPGMPEPMIKLGGVLLDKARSLEQSGKSADASKTYSAAADLLDEAVRLDLASVEGHYFLGSALFKTNELADAEFNLKQAIDAPKPSPEARLMLVNVFMKQRRYREALDQLTAYLTAKPDSPQRQSIEQMQAQIRTLLNPF